MRNRVGLILFLAVVSGLLAAYLAFRFLRQPTVTAVAQASEPAAAQVVLAARDLPAGHLVQPMDVRTVSWPAGNVPDGFARETAEVVGRGLIASVRMNEPMLSSKIASPESGNGLPLAIPPGMRAVAVRVNEVIGVAGWVHEGQRVDVLVTLDQGAQIDEPTLETVLQDITVLRIGQIQETNDRNEAVVVPVVTLAVTPDESQRLVLADTKGTIRLVLRNPLDRDTVDLQGVRARELVSGRRVVSTGGVRRAPVPVNRSIEVFRGVEKKTEDTTGRSGSGG